MADDKTEKKRSPLHDNDRSKKGDDEKPVPKKAAASESTRSAPAGEKTADAKPAENPVKGVHERHHSEREAMHKGHETERRDFHGNHREELRKMASRHAAAHKELAERHMGELGPAAGAEPAVAAAPAAEAAPAAAPAQAA